MLLVGSGQDNNYSTVISLNFPLALVMYPFLCYVIPLGANPEPSPPQHDGVSAVGGRKSPPGQLAGE